MTHEIAKFLNQAKKVTGSDYRTAQRLGVSRQYVSNVRNGRGMSIEFAFDLAELIGEDPASVLAANEVDRAKTPEDRARWAKYLTVAGAALAILAVVDPLGFDGYSMAYALSLFVNPYVLCVVLAGFGVWFMVRKQRPLSGTG